MLKSFDIRVQSRYSANWYASFVVDTHHNRVTFNQCDARRGGQVARYFAVTFFADGTVEVYAESAKGHRQETFSTTQCLSLCLRLLQEARSEARQVESVKTVESSVKTVKYVKTASTEEHEGWMYGIALALVTLIPVFFLVTLGWEAYATDVRITAMAISGLLSSYFLVNAYKLRKERYEEAK